MLQALIAEGLVRHQASDRTYHLGLHILGLAYQVLENLDIRNVAREELVRLRDITGEAAQLAVHNDLGAVYIDLVESGLAVGPINKLGTTAGLHSSAVGKSILAFLPPAEQGDILRRLPMTALTEHTITSRRTLRAQLRRSHGRATDSTSRRRALASTPSPRRCSITSAQSSRRCARPSRVIATTRRCSSRPPLR